MIDRYHSNEYYSGAQVRVYFGHLLIDEIASIEWAGTSTKRPVYGYASTTFDAVAQGQYLCQGAFLMPFKEVGFLYAVQQTLSNRSAVSQRIIDAIKQQNTQAQTVTVTPIPDTGGLSPRVQVSTRVGTSPEGTHRVEQLVTTLTPDDVLEEEATSGGRSFHDLVESLQETIWDAPGDTAEPIIRPDAFDVDPTTGFVQRGFNILVTFGDVNNPQQPSTVKSLIDVHLTGDQRVIATDGNPIFERYTFFCRATDETLGQYRIIPDRPSTPTLDASATPQPTPAPRTGHPYQMPEIVGEAKREKTETKRTADRILRRETTAGERLDPGDTASTPVRSSATRPNRQTSGVKVGRPFALGGGLIVTVASHRILPQSQVGHVVMPSLTSSLVQQFRAGGFTVGMTHRFDRGIQVELQQVLTDTKGRQWYYVRRLTTGEYAWIWSQEFAPT